MTIRLFITLAEPTHGGLQLLALRLAQHLKGKGHDVRIITRFMKAITHGFDRLEEPGISTVEGVEIEVISVRGWRRWLLAPIPLLRGRPKTFPLAQALYATAFRANMERILKNVDVVHFFGFGQELLGYTAWRGARKNESPFVIEPAIHVAQAGHGIVDWPLYKNADMVIAHSEFEAETLRRNGVRSSHVHAVRHGVDPLEPGDGIRFRKAHGIEGPIILFIGRRCDDKGYFRLLESFAVLHEQMPNVTLVIAGPGEIARSTARSVLELGRVTEEIKRDALSACTVFCLPSMGESFGMVYFEAWRIGKPVVGLDLPVLRETIGTSGGGLLAEPGNTVDLVKKLQILLEQPELAAAMGARGQEFCSHHSWNEAARSCLEAYAKAQQNQRT